MNIKLDMIGIVVKEVETSIAFYRALGLEIPEPDGPHHEITLESGVRLAWDAESMIREIDPEWTTRIRQRIVLAFLCASPEQVDARHDAIVAAGYRSYKAPWDAFWGQRYAQVADPDGNVVDLFAWLATEGNAAD